LRDEIWVVVHVVIPRAVLEHRIFPVAPLSLQEPGQQDRRTERACSDGSSACTGENDGGDITTGKAVAMSTNVVFPVAAFTI